jgi:hypothetical protein
VVIAPGMEMGGYGNMPYYWRPPPPPWGFPERGPWAWGPERGWPPRSGPGAQAAPPPRMAPSQPSPTPGG